MAEFRGTPVRGSEKSGRQRHAGVGVPRIPRPVHQPVQEGANLHPTSAISSERLFRALSTADVDSEGYIEIPTCCCLLSRQTVVHVEYDIMLLRR